MKLPGLGLVLTAAAAVVAIVSKRSADETSDYMESEYMLSCCDCHEQCHPTYAMVVDDSCEATLKLIPLCWNCGPLEVADAKSAEVLVTDLLLSRSDERIDYTYPAASRPLNLGNRGETEVE